MVSIVASSSSNSLTLRGRRGQLTIMTTSIIHEQINLGLNDIMLELSKQLAGNFKPMVENEVRNMHAQELMSIRTVNKSTTSCHFSLGQPKFYLIPFWQFHSTSGAAEC